METEKPAAKQFFVFGRSVKLSQMSFGLFDVLVEPAEKFAVPNHRVLGLHHLVVFVFEFDQTGVDTVQACCCEGFERLRIGNTEVEFAGDDHNRRIPLIDELVGRVGIGTHRRGVLLVPVGASVVVVDEEELLGLAVHRVEVEDAAVGDEALKRFWWCPARK